MTELLTAEQMRSLERAAIDSGAVTGLDLMERAGAGVVEAVLEEWPDLAEGPHHAVVFCGPGNNGGDGFVVARLLHARGWQVDVFHYGDAEKLPPDARVNYERWGAVGQVSPLTEAAIDGYAEEHPTCRLAVDALFGTGLARPFLTLARVQMEVNGWQAASRGGAAPHVVAVDIPSGLCADSGRYLGLDGETPCDASILANLTVTFHARKLGHVLADGPAACGRLVVRDIGLPASPRAEAEVTQDCGPPDARGLGKHAGHKYGHGHALILSGGFGRSGAARLAARGALRIGAGLVTLGAPGSAQREVASQITAVMLRRVEEAEDLALLLEDRRLNALCLGPGLGVARARALVPVALRAEHRPRVVLDADALTAFADDPAALFGMLHDTCVLTPHGGEFARLFPDIAEKLTAPAKTGPAFSKVDATRAAAKRAGCVVLYKGPDTVIAAPDGWCRVNAAVYDRAAPWLATAGAGDVLAGMICGLMARGFPAMMAAETAAWLHVEAARSFGPGLIAEDLPEDLPKIFRALGL